MPDHAAQHAHRSRRIGEDVNAFTRKALEDCLRRQRPCDRDGFVRSLASIFRIIENTHAGRKLYVDDLVTDETQRSQGVGKLLLDGLTEEARTRGCQTIDLDSGTQRTDAHRFYFRERMVVRVFGFTKPL